MHTTNVLAAWALEAHDALAAAAAELGLDQRQLAALTLVAEYDGCSIDWLRRRVGLSHPGTVRLVDRLEAAGLVRRTRDGREVALSATAQARRLRDRWHAAREAVVADLLAGLDPEQRASLAATLAAAIERRPRTRPQADALCRTCDWPACGDDCPVDRSVGAA
jgi:MarR family transcriptional repressor of emrRAB